MSSLVKKIQKNVEANKKLEQYTLYGSLMGSVIVTIGKLVGKKEDDMIKDFARFSKDEELAKMLSKISTCQKSIKSISF